MKSIIPGFYIARSIHIHVQVHTDWVLHDNGTLASGNTVSTGQIYLNETISEQLMALEPYVSHTEIDRTTNDVHSVYSLRISLEDTTQILTWLLPVVLLLRMGSLDISPLVLIQLRSNETQTGLKLVSVATEDGYYIVRLCSKCDMSEKFAQHMDGARLVQSARKFCTILISIRQNSAPFALLETNLMSRHILHRNLNN